MQGVKRTGAAFCTFGVIFLSITILVALYHYAFGNPIAMGRGGGTASEADIFENLFVFGGGGLIFFLVGVFLRKISAQQ